MTESISQKRCSRCGEIKPPSGYYRNKSKKGGIEVSCKICQDKAHRLHYATHPEKEKERCIKWSKAHPEYVRICQRKYRIAHPDKIAEWAEHRRALRANAEGSITAKQWSNLKEEYNSLCAYCGKEKSLAMDHVVPLTSGGRHDVGNIVPSCKFCNSSKNDSSLLMFLYRRSLA